MRQMIAAPVKLAVGEMLVAENDRESLRATRRLSRNLLVNGQIRI